MDYYNLLYMCWTTTAFVLEYERTSYLGYDIVCCVRMNNLGLICGPLVLSPVRLLCLYELQFAVHQTELDLVVRKR